MGTKENIETEKKVLKVFISYSWDNESHKEWVLDIANRLARLGVHVIFDGYDLQAGKDIDLFIEKGIREADKVLIILTPNYALRADKREGGVGEEYSIIRSEMKITVEEQVKFIPVLKSGDRESSCPSFLRRLVYHDMRDDTNFDENYNDLLREVFDKRKVTRPEKQEDLPEFLQ